MLFTTWIKWSAAIRTSYLFLVFLKSHCPLTSSTQNRLIFGKPQGIRRKQMRFHSIVTLIASVVFPAFITLEGNDILYTMVVNTPAFVIYQ